MAIGSHDLYLIYFVEKQYYDAFNNIKNITGTYSFEDWLGAHIAKMNELFALAKYPTSPDGIRDRVRVDKIVIARELNTGGCDLVKFKNEREFDGVWSTTDCDPENKKGAEGLVRVYTDQFVKEFDFGLIHEISHQLGVIDLYVMNPKNEEEAFNRGILVTDLNGNLISPDNLPLPLFPNGGIMGGGDVSPYMDSNFYDKHSAAALNANFGKRRGYFGEYLYDTPDTTKVKLFDKEGNPVAGADVSFYQKDFYTGLIYNNAKFAGRTDESGELTLPNIDASGGKTATAHSLNPNPFGQISVIGTNALMLLTIIKDGKEGYGFFLLHDLNLEFWKGNTSEATVTIRTNYPKISYTPTFKRPGISPSPMPVPYITPDTLLPVPTLSPTLPPVYTF